MAEGTTDSNAGNMRVLIVIPTYEPHYVHDLMLEDFYTQNFDSFLSAQGQLDVKLALTDFASSRSFKAFLKNYACSREGCYFIDGKPEASIHVAYNIALRYFDYDYAVVAQSDNRTRGGQWLELLLRDFDGPKVGAASSTATSDGVQGSEQQQPGPIERESRVVGSSNIFGLHCVVFSKRFLQHFDNRLPDVFEVMFFESALMYQIAALGYVAKMNFRVNLITDRLPGRTMDDFPRTSPDGRGFRNHLYEADYQKFMDRSTMIPGLIGDKNIPLAKKITRHWAALKRWRWRYFYFRFFSNPAFEDFCKLDVSTKVTILMALFFRPQSEYQQYSYSIYSSSAPDFAKQSNGLPALAVVKEA